MDTTKPLRNQYEIAQYTRIIHSQITKLQSKKHPNVTFTKSFVQYLKPIIPLFYHTYRTKEKHDLEVDGKEVEGFIQKKIISERYDAHPFIKFFLFGAFAAPWFYNSFWK